MIKLLNVQGKRMVHCDHCDVSSPALTDYQVHAFSQKHAHAGARRGVGGVIAAGIHATTGVQPCGACSRRAAAINGFFHKR